MNRLAELLDVACSNTSSSGAFSLTAALDGLLVLHNLRVGQWTPGGEQKAAPKFSRFLAVVQAEDNCGLVTRTHAGNLFRHGQAIDTDAVKYGLQGETLFRPKVGKIPAGALPYLILKQLLRDGGLTGQEQLKLGLNLAKLGTGKFSPEMLNKLKALVVGRRWLWLSLSFVAAADGAAPQDDNPGRATREGHKADLEIFRKFHADQADVIRQADVDTLSAVLASTQQEAADSKQAVEELKVRLAEREEELAIERRNAGQNNTEELETKLQKSLLTLAAARENSREFSEEVARLEARVKQLEAVPETGGVDPWDDAGPSLKKKRLS